MKRWALSTQGEILLGYLTASGFITRYGRSTQVEILLGYLTSKQGRTGFYLHK